MKFLNRIYPCMGRIRAWLYEFALKWYHSLYNTNDITSHTFFYLLPHLTWSSLLKWVELTVESLFTSPFTWYPGNNTHNTVQTSKYNWTIFVYLLSHLTWWSRLFGRKCMSVFFYFEILYLHVYLSQYVHNVPYC